MDRKIEKKFWTPKRIASYTIMGVLILFVLYSIIFGDKSSKLNTQKERLSIVEVQYGRFQDYITVTGRVNPIRIVFLDAIEGGQVEEIYIEEGSMVKKGDKILRLSNTNLNLSILNREAGLAEQKNNLRNTRLSMEQQKLNLKKDIVELEYLVKQQKREYENAQRLYEKDFISQQEFEAEQDKYDYYVNKIALVIESQKQDSLFRAVQVKQLENSLQRMEENLNLVRQKLASLNVKAPVSGQLASLNAEIGESKAQGQRIGQINVLDSYKINVDIDEHYISRVRKGLVGEFNFVNQKFKLEVTKIYPEVKNGRFAVDMEFVGKGPEQMRIGQTFRVKLQLGDPKQATLIPRGGFYQQTGGQWIFVVDESGEFSVKREIRLGSQNPRFYEVLEGLQPGEKVIVSSYDNFGEADKLILK